MRRRPALLTTALITAGLVVGGGLAADAAPAAVPAGRADARVLLDRLTVRSDSHAASYQRRAFHVWNDADRDRLDTRAEVLKAESRVTASVNRYGTVKGGRWISRYDNRVVTKATRLDVDHLVPLAEAWRSGAWKWSATRREAFGNDLGYGPSLIAVTRSSNRSKGDRDPAGWMPPASSYACAYVKQWIAVKSRWHLSVDRVERKALAAGLDGCDSLAVAKPGKPAISALVERRKTRTTTPKPAGGGASSAYYRNCDAVRAAGRAPLYRGQPGYETPRLDRDGDGVACE
ncbi:excalibur calcium-binding domain-containing protein [Amnibacterium endophyticum]|uniref:Excalibur calcium-binding domain-containing protein n=1 Tax=Amnibacterium endophyticum TaxID=2109337 RepID=A0ABW4LD93_9MICO